MKRFIFSALCVLLCAYVPFTSLSAQESEPYYCATPGKVLSFNNYDKKEQLSGSYTMRVDKCEGDMNNGSVSYTYLFYDEDGKPLFGDKNDVVMDVTIVNGVTSSKMHDMKKASKTQDLFSKGDASHIPAELKVGMTIKDGYISVHVNNFKSSVSVSNRKVTEEKDITVEAGTYHCFLVEEDQTNTVLGFDKKFKIKTWYAKNLGNIRQEVYDRKGKLISYQILTKVSN